MQWHSLFAGRWRRVGLIAGVLALGLLLGLRIFLMTPMAHSIVESRIEALSVRGQTIAIDRIHGDLLSGIRADRIGVSDDEGPWIEAEEARISWRLVPLLFGRLELKEIRASSVDVSRRPNLTPATGPSRTAPFDQYRVDTFSILNLSLAEGIAGPAQTYQLMGNLRAAGWTGELHLDLLPADASGDELQADLVWGGDALLAGEISLSGAPDGLISQLFGLRAGEGLTAHLKASGGVLGGEMAAQAKIGADTVLNLEANADGRNYQAAGRIALSRFERFSAIAQRLGNEIQFEASIDPDRRLNALLSAASGRIQASGTLVSIKGGRSLENMELTATELDAAKLTGVSAIEVAELSASGRIGLASGGATFDGRLESPSLSYDGYSFDDVSSDGSLSFTGGIVSVNSKLSFSPQDGFPASVQASLGPSVIAGVTATYSLPRSLFSIEGASLRGESLSITAAGTAGPRGPVALSGSFRLEAVSMIESIIGDFELNGDSFDNLELSIDGSAKPKSTAPQLLANLTSALTYDIRANRRENSFEIEQASLRSDMLSAIVAGSIEPDQIALTGNVEALLEGQIQEINGPLRSQVSVSGTLSEPAIDVSLKGNYQGDPFLSELTGELQDGRFIASAFDGEWRQLTASGKAAIEFASVRDSALNLAISGQVPNLSDLKAEISYQNRELASQMSLSRFEAGGISLESANMSLAGMWPEFAGMAVYRAEVPILGTAQSVAGMHPVELNAESRSVILSGEATIGNQAVTIQSPLKVSADPDFKLEGVLAGFGGEIDLDFDNSGISPSRLRLANIALADLGALIQRPGLTGTLNGAASLQLSEQGPDGSASFQIADLSRAGSSAARVNLTADVQLTDGRLRADVNATPPEQDASLKATLGTDLIGAGSVLSIRQGPGALTPIQLTGTGDIAPLWALAGLDLRLGGQFAVDLSNGDGRRFRFSGPASLTNGVFEDGVTGIYLEELEARLQLDTEAITVEQASARGAGGGSITARGTYNFNGDSDLEATLTRLRALRRDDVSTTLSGRASVERHDRRTRVEGDIRIDEMRVDLSKLPRAGYTVLDVQFRNGREDEEEESSTREAITLDLDVRADRRVFVVGPSFESEWGVDANVKGSPGAPVLTGAATIVRGEADVIGQRFDLSEGRIQFAGAPSDSELNLRADRTSDGVTTMIMLRGEVADPEITLGSDPSLPEDEVLARVLFGRSPSNLSPLQAAQLASAAAQLAGGNAFSLTGELQDATGLDRLDFGLDDEGQATLSTGKYLADDVYLEIESGATGAPAVAIEWTPLQNVEVDAEVDPELGPKVAIQWKRDFDRLPGEPREE